MGKQFVRNFLNHFFFLRFSSLHHRHGQETTGLSDVVVCSSEHFKIVEFLFFAVFVVDDSVFCFRLLRRMVHTNTLAQNFREVQV